MSVGPGPLGAATASRAAVGLPRPADPAPPLPVGPRFPTPGLTPFSTPDPEFYRVDTAAALPQTWAAHM